MILTAFLPSICSAQTEADNLTQEDYEAMLALNKMNVYKFPVKIPEDQKCMVVLYKQEYDRTGMIEDENIFGSHSPHRKVVDRQLVLDDDGEPVLTPLDGIRIITKEEGRDFALGFKIGEFEIPSMPLKIDSIYALKHYARSFSLPDEFPIGSEIPLFFIGSSWNATDISGQTSITKFCIEEEVSPDFSDEQFRKMPHYIVFGIRIIEQD